VQGPLTQKPVISRTAGTSRYTNSRPDCSAADSVYLNAAQVAEIVQVDPKTILRWSLEDASMPVLRRGRVVRFPRERLLAWLQRQKPRSSAQGRRTVAADSAKELVSLVSASDCGSSAGGSSGATLAEQLRSDT
jgi:hypothetical protein